MEDETAKPESSQNSLPGSPKRSVMDVSSSDHVGMLWFSP